MKVGFLGVGNMAGAIINGIKDSVGLDNVMLFDTDPEKCRRFTCDGAVAAVNAADLFNNCDFVFLAVKPQNFASAVKREDFASCKAVIISIMAGITISKIAAVAGDKVKIVRAMPNAPMMNKTGTVGLCKAANVTDAEMSTVKTLFSSVALVTEVTEDKLSAVTALSGSGPAYFYLFTKYIAEYGVDAGLDEETAYKLAVRTALGAALTMDKGESTLDELIRIVRSPNGTTEKALESFEQSGLSDTVKKALKACEKRADELASDK